MKNKNLFLIILISILGIGSLIYSVNIKQKNPETIFLTNDSIKQYEDFKKKAPEKHTLILKRKIDSKADRKKILDDFYRKLSAFEEFCNDTCEIMSQRSLSKKDRDFTKIIDHDFLSLEGEDFVSVLFLDDTDTSHKKILDYASHDLYWNDLKITQFAGMSYTNYLLDHYSAVIQDTLFPAMFILGFLVTFFFVNHFLQSVILYLPCLMMAGVSLTTLKFYDGTMNMVTAIIPLVIFTVSLSLSFHMFFSLREFKTMKTFLKRKWQPVFLMMFTTYIGFLSLMVAKISVIRDFGLLSSQLVLVATGIIFLWYYLFEEKLQYFPIKDRVLNISRFFKRSCPKSLIWILVGASIFSMIYFPNKLEIITDATRYFPKESKLREAILDVTQHVAGMPIAEIIIEDGEDFNDQAILKKAQIERDLTNLALSQKYQILSNNNLVTKANFEYSGKFELPDNFNSYLALRSQLPFSLQESYPIEKNYRMTILGKPLNVKDYMQDIAAISKVLNAHGAKFEINGMHHNLMVSQNSMIDILYESFISSALVVFICSAFYLKTFKNIMSFVIVSTIPIMLTFLMMWIFNYSVNIATVMTFSIALGLLGDSAFHVFHARRVPFKSFDDYSAAVLTPVVVSGILFFTCFIIFIFNSFLPIREFGGILAFMILLGMLCDLYLLPTLIYSSSKHEEEYMKVIN